MNIIIDDKTSPQKKKWIHDIIISNKWSDNITFIDTIEKIKHINYSAFNMLRLSNFKFNSNCLIISRYNNINYYSVIDQNNKTVLFLFDNDYITTKIIYNTFKDRINQICLIGEFYHNKNIPIVPFNSYLPQYNLTKVSHFKLDYLNNYFTNIPCISFKSIAISNYFKEPTWLDFKEEFIYINDLIFKYVNNKHGLIFTDIIDLETGMSNLKEYITTPEITSSNNCFGDCSSKKNKKMEYIDFSDDENMQNNDWNYESDFESYSSSEYSENENDSDSDSDSQSDSDSDLSNYGFNTSDLESDSDDEIIYSKYNKNFTNSYLTNYNNYSFNPINEIDLKNVKLRSTFPLKNILNDNVLKNIQLNNTRPLKNIINSKIIQDIKLRNAFPRKSITAKIIKDNKVFLSHYPRTYYEYFSSFFY